MRLPSRVRFAKRLDYTDAKLIATIVRKKLMPFSAQTIFITGFPGFIAERLVKHLAKLNARFILLVQPSLLERARSDVARIAVATGTDTTNFSIVAGDITEENLGMSAADADRARSETTTLFHLAAIYDLAVARDLAMHVNLDGTRNVNQFRSEE